MQKIHIISIENAKLIGIRCFFTGEKCANNHYSVRYVTSSKCAECIADRGKKRREIHGERLRLEARTDYSENKEKYAKYNKTYRNTNQSSLAASKSRYYEENKEKIAEYQKEYRAANGPRLKSVHDDYRSIFKQKVITWNRNRKARYRNADGFHSFEDVMGILVSQERKCNSCFSCVDSGYHVDHVMPLALGGSNWPSNLQILCPACNMKKGSMHPDDWNAKVAAAMS